MLHTEWPDAWRGAFRIELRTEAVDLAMRGWPVFPGTYPTGGAWNGPQPVSADWRTGLGATPDEVAECWHEEPYSVLVATGTVVDAIEVDDELGRRAACLLRAEDRPAPILAMPNGRWMFLTASGPELPPELAGRSGVIRHAEGGWVALPPSPYQGGIVHWRVKPAVWGWKLPHAAAMHGVLGRAAGQLTEAELQPTAA
ncbi:MAG: bifunctional DNA primase/polymerase [Thermocrispum sp.]